jgi:type IV pilus assembly protein PilY1
MRKLVRIQSIATMAALTCLAGGAAAQTEGPDVVAQQPNVLLLVDTSGSMEWKSSGPVSPVCDPLNPNTSSSTTNEKSRWIELVETLTGSVNNYSCYAEARDGTTNFKSEFQLSATDLPYDLGYPDAYHRPLSAACAPGPGVLPPAASPYSYPAGAFTTRPFVAGSIQYPGTPCAFSQATDGLLDSFDGLMRFGLMTFDTDQRAGTGVIGGVADNQDGLKGTWSYYLTSPSLCRTPGGAAECKTGPTSDPLGCCLGSPANCPTPSAYEVGARNAAAPPWEGRMVSFGPSAGDGAQQNQWIQQVLLSSRPYGATPIAGMMSDARDFLWHDTTPDPLNNTEDFGPSRDPLVVAQCRPNYIILLTDGEPNMDLRPACEDATGDAKCPYEKTETIANDLVTSISNPKVRTFVVGFALGSASAGPDAGAPIDCATMNLALCSPTPTDPQLRACCTLNNIAYNGTPQLLRGQPPTSPGLPPEDHALFPKNPLQLRSSISRILQQLLVQVTGRTSPVTATSTDSSLGAGFQFTSGANVLRTGLWKGILNRQRITCDASLVATPQPVDPKSGDDFVANVNANPTASDRYVFSVQPDQVGSTLVRQAAWSIRPYLETTITDGVGHYSGAQTTFDAPATLSSDIAPETMNVTAATCGTSTAAACRTQLLEWAVGLPTATPVSRCAQPGNADCSVIGDIFHSQPQVRPGQPGEFLRDSTYSDFSALYSKRDTVLYTSSNDGFFHAFRIAPGDPTDVTHRVNRPVNNQVWSFIPPAVLPSFTTMYPLVAKTPLNRIPALDGVPVLKDVAVTKGGPRGLNTTTYPFRFERKKAPDTTKNEIHTWRTIMVESFGAQRGAYFALDVTDPAVSTTDATKGPKFLWQLATDDVGTGNHLFGKGGGTPLITTLFMKTDQSPEVNREVAVAVLPGGIGDSPTTATASPGCPADKGTAIVSSDGGVTSTAFRSSIRCYDSANSVAARSLTIVKLDTGEVIRTFRPEGVTLPVGFPTGATGIVTDYTWDKNQIKQPLALSAPIVGQPVAYPAQAGAIADRLFVGDAEGRIWRIDVSNPDPALWQMNVFFDPYDQTTHPLGQPVQTPPVLSVDKLGQITLAFSTGDQNSLTPDPNPSSPVTFNYVASITEAAVLTGGVRTFRGQFNWSQEFAGGGRVLGPMVLFDRTLYFSTFAQIVTPNCTDIGSSSVWGLDYLLPLTAGVPTGGAKQNLATIAYPNVVVSGVGLRQLPSCSSGSAAGASSDSFLGYGSVTTTSTTNPGTFELVIQKGGGKGSGASSTTIPTDKIALPTPSTPVRIDSWAPIIE